ncbi:sigma-70 family RNA polymerase sigma factor [Corynebacterium suranareeae]|nr:sigma-70 family RNA polymerase sigma factor [Corynebacterium suranareeae]
MTLLSRQKEVSEISDAQLVKRFISGDARAFSTIVDRHERHMLKAAKRYSRKPEDAQDILQEALFRASRNMHLYRAEASLGTWLHTLVLNSGFDWATHRCQVEFPVLHEPVIDLDKDPRIAVDPLGYLDVAMTIRKAIDQLHPDQRIAIILVDLGGYTVEDVAEIEGVKVGTVKSRRGRARKALRALLHADFFGPED